MRKIWSDNVAWGAQPTEEWLTKWWTTGASDVTGAADRAGMSTRFATWWLGRIENSLTGTGGFAVGNKLSLADVLLYNAFAETLKEEECLKETAAWGREPFGNKALVDAALAKCPKISASIAAVAGNANFQKWLATRGKQAF